MKGWPYYLRCVWRSVRIPVAIIMLLVSLLCFIIWLYVNAGFEYHSRTISPKQGNFDAVVEEKCCNADGVCAVTVKLHRRTGWGLDTKIFVYDSSYEPPCRPWTHDAFVVWLSANELEIAVDRVSYIDSHVEDARGVKVTYHIGSVGYP
jgi:hypothetical protein